METQKIIIIAVLVFIVIAAIVFVAYQFQESVPIEEEYVPDIDEFGFTEDELVSVEEGSILDDCGTQDTLYARDLCWLYEAGDELDASKCANIEDRPMRINCIRGIAVAFQTEETIAKMVVCNELLLDIESENELDDFKIQKFYECYEPLESQIRAEKTAICDEFFTDDEVQRYMCHATIAVELEDTAICDTLPIQPTDFKQHCLSMVVGEFD